ncbi:sodium:alanine symporter family protein [Cutibacterium acnes JCM 18916]|nr:sodium:alanine symporter family protein [Cutibacterium acnes JCM 18916]
MASILDLADAMLFLMALPNVLGMYFLARVVAREIKGHRERIDAGVIPQVPEDAQVGMMVVNEATPEQLENADTEYALRAAAQDARSKELQLGHTAPDTERDYLQHLPEDHEIFLTPWTGKANRSKTSVTSRRAWKWGASQSAKLHGAARTTF